MENMVLAGLRWAASPVVNKLLADASTYLGVDMAHEIQELETTILPQIDLVIEAAEKSPHRGKLEAWLRKLKDAFYTAEELLDGHEYNQLKLKAKNAKEFSLGVDTSSIKAKILKPLHAATSRASNLLPENRKLIRQLKELKDILSKAKDFCALFGLPAFTSAKGSVVAATVVPPATSLPPPKVFGRDADRDRIIDLLTKESAAVGSSSSYSGVAIVGHGGAGKSTLAQHVYNDDRVKEHFDIRMWVCISRRIDVHRHTRGIIESAEGKCPHVDNLDTLQCKLRDILNSKKFLLVLDDIWFEESNNETEWDKLLDPLVPQQAGSKVLVTSRRDVLPAALCCKEVIRMENMGDAEFLALFKHHAFSGADLGYQRVQLQLEEIAEKIAKRLGHSPLAAKVLGSQLSRKKDINAWKDALKINNLSEPVRALLWSYEKLDPRLQRCFLYCSLFPKGYSYNMYELVDLWVAEGLVDACNHNRRIEDIGYDYFNELLSGSFFQLVSGRFVMHDLLHDLAESLSREDCFRLEDDNVADIPCTVRHLSIRVQTMKRHKQIICKLRHLRTIICIAPVMDDASDIFDQILQNTKKLRVLYLSFYNSRKLPESVGELKHLRYLNIVKTFISELPISLCDLYHLQLLQFNDKVKSLPDKLCNLSKLRHLEGYVGMQMTYGTPVPQIPNIGKLTSLQQLNEFSIQRNKGYELEQLRDMNELGGSLRVTNLENINGMDEALESNLHKKSRLTKLHLVWSCENDKNGDDSLHLDILEGFKPPPQLNAIEIEGCKSATYPSWLLEGSYLENLEYFGLVNCSVLEGLPSDTYLFRHCYEMVLDNVPNLKKFSFLPAGLASLSISRCQRLMFITDDELEQHDEREHVMNRDNLASRLALLWEVDSRSYILEALSGEHSSLEQLMILMDDDISKHLQTIKLALKGDKELVKEDVINAWLCCHEQRIRLIHRWSVGLPPVWPLGLRRLNLFSCSITDGALSTCLSNLTSLRELSLEQIMNLTALPSEEVFQRLTTLGSLKILFCWCLRSLGGLRASASLSEVILVFCPSLDLARGSEFMPVSLENLSIYCCVVAADFFCTDLPNLKDLTFSSCRSSAVLPVGRLTSLQSFALLNLPDLCVLEGLSSLQLHNVHLIDVPNLAPECISEYRVQKSLHVSSSVLLNNMVTAEGVTVPVSLSLQRCTEPSVSFKKSANFSSVQCLKFLDCSMKSLPENLEYLSSLEDLEIIHCPNISSLPYLPSSLQSIRICNCELLKESCRSPDGESWPKIAYIRWKDIV
ncbi:unnamed protein product [Urochloa decumbens]|uniref:Rp1-like protein n=1 Tax=Urochloa decumbens TaxID=240449 RepID=A0ABC9B137_9POAL